MTHKLMLVMLMLCGIFLCSSTVYADELMNAKLITYCYDYSYQYTHDSSLSETIAKAAVKQWTDEKVSALMIMSVIYQESTFNPKTKGRAGERGLMQIHPGWWRTWGKNIGLDIDASRLYEPEYNIQIGAALLLHYGWSSGDILGMLTRYNGKRSYAVTCKKRYDKLRADFWTRYSDIRPYEEK